MSSNKSEKKDKAPKKKYRIFIRNDETLQEVFTLKLNFIAIYLFITSLLLLFLFLVWLLIAYTPLKRLMPGYDDVYIHPEYVNLSKKVDELTRDYEDQQYYIESFRNLLMGEAADSITPIASPKQAPSSSLDLDTQVLVDLPKIISVENIKDEEEEERKFIKIKSEEDKERNADKIRQLYLIPPVKGVITNSFDPVKRHYGIDLSAPKNTAIKAVLGGHVISADWTLDTGNTICILHDNNVVSFYKHNAANLVKIGTYVSAGEAVAIIGNTGTKSSGPHLHFELWLNGSPVNPVEYINF